MAKVALKEPIMNNGIYLDYNSTSPVCDEAKQAVMSALNIFANPSAIYRSAEQSKALVRESRQLVAALINAEPDQVFFTSGGTEANNWVVNAVLPRLSAKAPVVTSAIEHHAILSAIEAFCAVNQRQYLSVEPGKSGLVDSHTLLQSLLRTAGSNTASYANGFITLMLANNETGAIQPVNEIGRVLSGFEKSYFFHVDAVQAAGKTPIDVKAIGCDSLSLSAHKFSGPKGVGALYIRDPRQFSPWILGGSQESGLRSGTENLVGIAGMGAAANVAKVNLSASIERMRKLRYRLLENIRNSNIECSINSPDVSHCLANSLSLSFDGVRAEALAAYLSFKHNIEVSVGSACSNNRIHRQSHVLKAMKLNNARIDSAIRVSFGWQTRAADIDTFTAFLAGALEHLRAISSSVNIEQVVE